MVTVLKDRILKLLNSRPNDTFTSKQVAYLLNANNNSIRNKLMHLVNSNKIIRVTKGLYQSTFGLVKEDIDPNIRFHGIKFEHRCNKSMGWSYLDLYKIVTDQLKTPWIRKHPKNKSISTSVEWEQRIITITLHKPDKDSTSLLEVFCKSSMLPLHPIEVGAYCGFLQGVFKIPYNFWILTQIGVNIDLKNVQLDTWNNISMKEAQERILRMYQKAKDLRLECHINPKKRMTARETLDYFEKILIVADEFTR